MIFLICSPNFYEFLNMFCRRGDAKLAQLRAMVTETRTKMSRGYVDRKSHLEASVSPSPAGSSGVHDFSPPPSTPSRGPSKDPPGTGSRSSSREEGREHSGREEREKEDRGEERRRKYCTEFSIKTVAPRPWIMVLSNLVLKNHRAQALDLITATKRCTGLGLWY